jgi:hypothetical protein
MKFVVRQYSRLAFKRAAAMVSARQISGMGIEFLMYSECEAATLWR